jgi:hypothetical protein
MELQRRAFSSSSLELVTRLEDIPGTRGPLHIGDKVRLNSGGPVMLVVDVKGDHITVATPDQEYTFPRPCLALIDQSFCASAESVSPFA